MKFWIRQQGSNDFRGPFTREELTQQIGNGDVSWDEEALEATGQSYGALKRSSEWYPLRGLLSLGEISFQQPKFPAEYEHCFILTKDDRRGPYLPAQIRTMWENGSITADSLLTWNGVADPVSITILFEEPRFTKNDTVAEGNRNLPLNVLGVVVFVGGIIGLVYYWQFFDTSVSVPNVYSLGQTFGGGRVHNLGLMQERQNGMIISGIAAALGFISIMFGQRGGGKK